MKVFKIVQKISEMSPRGAWQKGVKEYALELLEQFVDNTGAEEFPREVPVEDLLLNGAENWSQYSWGGCSSIFDRDIAERLCSASEFALLNNGERKPNKNEEWLDIQARALYQASALISRIHKGGK